MVCNRMKLIPDIEQDVAIVRFVQKPFGKIVLLLFFAIPLLFLSVWWKEVLVIITAITFMPKWRRWWVLLGMIILQLEGVMKDNWGMLSYYYILNPNYNKIFTSALIAKIMVVSIVTVFLFSTILAFLTQRFQHKAITQRPTLNLFFILFVLLGAALYAPLSVIQNAYLWFFILAFGHYFWFIAYTLQDCKTFSKYDFLFEYGRYSPIWGSSAVPFPKGSSYLHRIEAKTNDEFAITQLKGLKLILWAGLINTGKLYLSANNFFDVPTLRDALIAYEQGTIYPLSVAWQCITLNFFNVMLTLTLFGHTIIAICRMCGYRALRNTYKPLYSTNIAEFWNRYYYYFKELLVEFFFYPAYFRYFKTMPRLRLFFATFAAAGIGNIIYHFFYILPGIRFSGLFNAIKLFHVYICYGVILGVAIGLSQLRNSNLKPRKLSLPGQVFSIIFVVSFYMLASIFNETYQSHSIMINIRFLCSLFNITW
jgi:hypothetical protein